MPASSRGVARLTLALWQGEAMSEVTQHAPGQIVVVTRNAISEAIATIAEIAGRQVVVLGDDDPEGTPRERLTAHPPTLRDAVVISTTTRPRPTTCSATPSRALPGTSR